MKRGLLTASMSLVLLSCAQQQAPSSSRLGGNASREDRAHELRDATQTSLPASFAEVVRNAHFAYRRDREGFAAAHHTYLVDIDGERLRVRPRAPATGKVGSAIELTISSLPGARIEGVNEATHTTPTGDLVRDRSGVREVLRNGPSGIEQSWFFDAMPGARSDVEVRVRVDVGTFVARTASGLHFTDGATGMGIRYGLAVWRDSGRMRRRVNPTWDASRREIVMNVPDDILRQSTCPCVLDPWISPEHGIDTVLHSPAPGDQIEPAVASMSMGHMAVWQDERVGNYDIYGARFDNEGMLLDPSGIPIATLDANEAWPTVASNGSSFLVAWVSDALPGNNDIFGNVVRWDGSVAYELGIPISTASGNQGDPAVAAQGDEYLAVWTDVRSGTSADIYGTRIAADGSVHDPSGVPIAQTSNTERTPAIASDGSQYLVVWPSTPTGAPSGDLAGAFVDTSGASLGTDPFIVSNAAGEQGLPSVASDGSGFVVAWQDHRAGNADIYTANVTTDGEDISIVETPIVTRTDNDREPSVASDQRGYIVLWTHVSAAPELSIEGVRLSADGELLDASPRVLVGAPGYDDTVVVSSAGEGYFGAFRTLRLSSTYDIAGLLIESDDAGLSAVDFLASGTGWGAQSEPAVAALGDRALLVWSDNIGTGVHVMGARVSEQGTFIDGSGIVIATTELDADPAVAANAESWLVAWQQGDLDTDVHAAKVGTDGTVGDHAVISDSGASERDPTVASNGTEWLVAWQHQNDIRARRVGESGAVIGASFPISAAERIQAAPRAASDGNAFLVVWQDDFAGSFDIRGTRISAEGTLLDLEPFEISADEHDEVAPAVAFDGMGYFVAWQNGLTEVAELATIWSRRVAPDGTLLDGATVPVSPTGAIAPDVAAADGVTMIVWQSAGSESADVVARRYMGGVALDDAPFAIATSSDDEIDPAAAAFAADSHVVTYTRFDSTPGFSTTRVRTRWITEDAGTSDAAVEDGAVDDAGPRDAGEEDAGAEDGAVLVDAGGDGGTEQDANIADAGFPHPHHGHGCNCRPLDVTDDARTPPLVWLVALAFLFVRRRIRRHS